MTMQFRGNKIVTAILADLQDATVIPSPNLKNATQVLVTGSSAGSFGAASNIDWIASQLPSAKVKGVLDSSWVPPLPNYRYGSTSSRSRDPPATTIIIRRSLINLVRRRIPASLISVFRLSNSIRI